MLERAGCRAMIVDSESEKQLDRVLEGICEPLLIIVPDREDAEPLAKQWPRHTFVGSNEMEAAEDWQLDSVSPDSIAYLLFTSGSTGIPKGVMVAHRNVIHFVDTIVARYGITEEDRFSQTFDMTFDLSVFDMFVAWERGACVCCPNRKTLINPGKFIQEAQLTVWFSVPSTAVFMKRLGMLKANQYPTLRWSLFCGEPLPIEVAKTWAEAAPQSVLENLYGPTELTIACSLYRWNPDCSAEQAEFGLVPIGEPFPGMHALVVDEALSEVSPGTEGELLMTGPQLTLGYWQDPARTGAAFVIPPGRNTLYYRTGDRVRRPAQTGPMNYLGRLDHQIKVHGYRVELGEIEAVLREESGIDSAAALGWPITPSGAAGVIAFLGEPNADVETIRARLKIRLPSYMVPREIRLLRQLPYNANGKVDRSALYRMLEVPA